MRIAFDVTYIQKNRTGIGRHSLQLIKALLAIDTQNEYVLHGWSLVMDCEAIGQLKNERATISVARISGDIKRLYWNNIRFPVIETFVGKLDVFHSTDPFLPPTNGRTVCTVHDLAYKKFPALFERRVRKWDALVQRSIQSADAVIVPSEQTKTDACEMLHVDEKKIYVVKLPVNEIFSSTKTSADEVVKKKFFLEKPYILFVGTIEPRKNIPFIVKAFERVHERIDLVLVGRKGWHTSESFHAIESFKKKERIHYLEYITDEELASLYRQALCFVYPSLYEGYGFPILEAMASGIPIITSDNSSMGEIADNVALLVDPSSVDEIAEAMNMLVADEVRRVEMRQRGFQIIQHYTANRAAKAVLQIYHSLAS